MKKRVADIIMDILCENGITDCFAVVGGGAMHLDNALGLCENISKVFNHHEQACAMAAESYARLTGKLAAVCVTSGPGGTNTLTGILGSWQDSLPVLVLSGQVRYETTLEQAGLPLRYRGVQEFDIVNSIGNMTKYAVMVKDPLAIKRELQKAIDTALWGRRGPVWVDVPLNVQSAVVDEDELYPAEPLPPLPCASDSEILELIGLLRGAKRPCLMAGNGIANTHTIAQFREFAKRTGVPVIAAAIAADAMPTDDEQFFGTCGSIGPRVGNFIVQNADLIVAFGCTMGFKISGFAQDAFAPHATIITVDIDEHEQKKPGVHIDRLIHSDLALFFAAAKKLDCGVPVAEDWKSYCVSLKSRFSSFEGGENVDDGDRVCSYRFWKTYRDYEPDDSISVLGNNTANSAKLQIGIAKPDQRIVANNNCGSMGADLPEAVGAAVATKKTVVCITGDGSVMMNLQELQTIVHYNLPVKLIIFSNEGYNAIYQTCKNFFGGKLVGCNRESGVSFPSFEKLAYAFDFPYRKCATNAQIGESLKWLFESDGYALLEVLQRIDDPVLPKVMSRINADGTFATPAIQDMFPFLPEGELESLMLW